MSRWRNAPRALFCALLFSLVQYANCQCNAGYTGSVNGLCTACPAGKYKDFIGSFANSTATDLLLSGVRNHTFLDGRWMYIGQYASRSLYMHSSGNYHLRWESFRWRVIDILGTYFFADGAFSKTLPTDIGSTWNEVIHLFPDVPSSTMKFTAYSDCTNCPAGKFSTSTAATSIATCTGGCPANSFSGTGSSVITECQCNFGYTGSNGGLCTVCGAGKYKSSWGNNICDGCSQGKFSNHTGAITQYVCTDCPAGKMTVSSSGSVACIDCVTGKFASSSSQSVCSNCAAGKYSGTGFTVCCANSSYCGNNEYMLSGTCQSCPAQSTAPACSTTLTSCLCNPGFSGPNGGPCTACKPGFYKSSVGSGNNNNCFSCTSGKYQDTSVAINCKSCPSIP